LPLEKRTEHHPRTNPALRKTPLLNYVIASLVTIAAPILWVGTLLGLPGNWGLVALAVALAYFAPDSAHSDIHSPALISIVAMAIAGEVIEFIAGAAGVNQLGGSRKGTVLAVVGSIVGAVVGMLVGVPVPIVGSLIAALLFGGLGAFGGAVAGERWAGKDWDLSIRIGWGALWGKLLGTLLKTICGTAIMILLLYSVWA
jgi:uncharacterized protein YqgC (DUF456 family)